MRRKLFCISVENYVVNILLVILQSIVLSVLGALLSDVVNIANVMRYVRAPLLFVLNTIPLTLIMLIIYHITSRHWASFSIGGGLYLLMHVINRFMLQLREEPLFPQDLVLGMEAANTVKISELPFSEIIICSFAFWLLMSVALFFLLKPKKLRWYVRVAGVVVSAALSFAAFTGIYKNTELYNSFKVTGTIYNRANLYKSRGFAYSFLVKTATYKSIKPDNYSYEEARQILSGYDKATYAVNEKKLPHIVAVMGEAFYDIDRIPGIEFNEGFNPLNNFDRISGEAYTGRIVAEVFGGGTANTEFSFLTGHLLSVMPEMTNPYSYHLRKDTFSLARVLEKKGYATMAFHPGESWFYNRVNVYKFFGFDNIYFKKNMDLANVEINHGYVSDVDTAEFAIEKFKAHLSEKPGVPFFEFVVNIDNHGPYSKKDLGYPKILKRKDTMDDETYNIINNYLYGLMRCDKGLGFFVDSLREINEPVVFLFFADHLPFLGETDQGYKALGFEINPDGDLDAYLNHYETPYFIWCNEAAKKLLNDNGITPRTGKAPHISPNYLATELLEYAGIDGGNYFNYLSEMKKILPVISNRFYNENGTYTEEPSKETVDIVNQYSRLQYYMMTEKDAITP